MVSFLRQLFLNTASKNERVSFEFMISISIIIIVIFSFTIYLLFILFTKRIRFHQVIFTIFLKKALNNLFRPVMIVIFLSISLG